jgi:hypothetical protein
MVKSILGGKVKIVCHERKPVLIGNLLTGILLTSLILMSPSFLQISFSQGPNANSNMVNGTLEIGGKTKINASSATDIPNATETTGAVDSKYDAARDQFLRVWDTLEFHPIVATFVNESAKLGNGVYQEHSNVFNPGETMALYVQPIGFGHKEITGQNGEKLFLMNFTADIIFTFQNGTIIGGGQDVPAGQLMSHYKNTEVYLHLFLTNDNPLPKGDYKINYKITDEVSGKSFKLTKDVRIA